MDQDTKIILLKIGEELEKIRKTLQEIMISRKMGG